MSIDDLLKELQEEYIQTMPEKIQELKDFFTAKDEENLLNAFHKLKGSGKTYGIDEVSTLGQFFETWMRDKKEKVIPFVPRAILILERIYAARAQHAPYPIEADADFLKLQTIK